MDLVYRTAGELAHLLRTREVSAREVVQAHLDRVERTNRAVNAIVTLTAEQVIAEARAADDRTADDIADVVVAALTEDGHAGQVYELTGPRLLTWGEAVAEVSKAAGREIQYVPITTEQFAAGMIEAGAPAFFAEHLAELFAEVLDGRGTRLTDGVQRALDRPPKDFADYAREIGGLHPVRQVGEEAHIGETEQAQHFVAGRVRASQFLMGLAEMRLQRVDGLKANGDPPGVEIPIEQGHPPTR